MARSKRGASSTRSILLCGLGTLLVGTIVITALSHGALRASDANTAPAAHGVLAHAQTDSAASSSASPSKVGSGEGADPSTATDVPGSLGNNASASIKMLAAFNSAALEELLVCRHAPLPDVSSARTVAAYSQQRNQLRYKKCFHASKSKFLYFGNHWGRHFNQMTSLVAALSLAHLLGRTLVLPPLQFEGHRIHIYDLYDARFLFDVATSPYCVLTEEEFFSLESEKQQRANDNIVVDAACVSMRGIKQHPQLPLRFKFACTETLFIKYKKELQLFIDVAGRAAARFLTLPLVIYYAQALPEEVVRCPWTLVRAHPVVQRAVELLMVKRTFVEHLQNHVIEEPIELSVGIHLRSLEGSCQNRQREKHALQGRALQEANSNDVALQQCLMGAEYIRSVAQRVFRRQRDLGNLSKHLFDVSGNLLRGAATYIVADDGQQPQRAKQLVNDLGDAFRIQDVVTATRDARALAINSFARYIAGVKKGPKATLPPHEIVDENTVGTHRVFHAEIIEDDGTATPPYAMSVSRFHEMPSALFLLIDFWTLANATVFVGNQVSTLSMNVCRWRRANGRMCDNFLY